MFEGFEGAGPKEKAWLPDLHTHSQASDGALTPSELVLLAKERGLNLLALTDHDTLSGIDEAQAAAGEQNITLISGIELSTEGDEEIHILGYFVRRGCPKLDRLISAIQADRISRESRYLDALESLGLHLSHDDLAIPRGAMFSRPLLAQAMVKKAYVATAAEAFERYIGAGKPAYVPKMMLRAEEAVAALRDAGALPVLAHPGEIRNKAGLFDRVASWQKAGLMGIEAYHPGNSRKEQRTWDAFARERGMLVTGGSDYHRWPDSKHADLGQMLTYWRSASSDAEHLLKSEPLQ